MDAALPVFLFAACVLGLALALLAISQLFNPKRPGAVKRMPYESGMDPVHDTRRRFDVRFHLMAIAFLVFDVELLFLYPWAVAMRPAPVPGAQSAAAVAAAPQGIDAAVASGAVESRDLVFAGAMVFIALLTVGFIYDWRRGIFRWR
jgi:NADH-quinone oxidoreductase subunit A